VSICCWLLTARSLSSRRKAAIPLAVASVSARAVGANIEPIAMSPANKHAALFITASPLDLVLAFFR
jgi:hypothetical protein